ncbi:hypothetical protein PZH36_00270 [Ruminococcus bromii]|uniref:hypothetical protein n=1 Tax=Ruminococcus bromii TaxID=40518 RepID=UPI00292ECDB1|nr:hypothetical protein [Ruminococcus bromii]MDE8725570.1 hypothetical protein [Ruminococcus bromii]
MGAGKGKLSKIPYTVLQFNEDGKVVNEVSHNLESIYLDPYRVEAIARTILPDIQAYYQTEEGNAAFKKWQAEQAALGTSKPIAKSQKRRRKKS